jgi:putative membrane protein
VRFVCQGLAAALGFWVASRFVHGVVVYDMVSLVLAGFLLAIINMVVRPILQLLTLPLTIITFGLFLLVVNGITVWLATVFLHGVRIEGLVPAIITAVIISVLSWLTHAVFISE